MDSVGSTTLLKGIHAMIMRLYTKPDVNGNSRRLWVVTANHKVNHEGDLVFWPKPKPEVYKEHYNSPEQIQGLLSFLEHKYVTTEITPSAFNRILKNKHNDYVIMQD